MIAAIWSARGQGDVDRRLTRIIRTFGQPDRDWRRNDGVITSWGDGRAVGQCAGESGVFVGNLRRKSESTTFDAGESLAGNFALVGWHRSGGLVVARGAVGGDALYIGHDGDAWIASSRLDAVLLAFDAAPAFDLPHLAALAAGISVDGALSRKTPYAHVARLRSGERAIVPVGAADVHSFLWTNEEMAGTFDAGAERLAPDLWQAARASVGRAMAGVRTVGVLAGGGLDSSGLLAAAVENARDLGVTVVPLAIDFAGPGDDRPHRAALESFLGVEATTVTPEEAAPYLAPSLVVDGRPSLYPSLSIICAAAEAGRRRGVERILTGFLGDLVLDAPPNALLAQFVSGAATAPILALRGAAKRRSPWKTTTLSRVREMIVHPLLRPLVPARMRQARRRRYFESLAPWSGPSMREVLANLAREPSSEPSLATAYDRYVSLSTNVQMVEQIDTRAQLEILSGLEFREPWMDDEFVRHIARIPPWMLSYGDRDRGLFRHALRGHVPDSLRLRPDKAEIEPALDRMLALADNRGRLGRLGRGAKLSQLGIASGAKLGRATTSLLATRSALLDADAAAAAEEARARQGATWTALWPAFATEALLERKVAP